MHEHEGCPHDHEGDVCSLGIDSDDGNDDMDQMPVEAVEIAADAAVAIAEIEAETAQAEINASLEHHHIEADLEEARIDADHEEVMEEIEADEELAEAVEELEEALTEPEAEESVVAESPDLEDSEGGEGDLPVSVAPPARIEAPNDPKKPRRQSAFSARHTRRH